MPRCVRNFWLEASIDGKQTDIATGPRAKDGGMEIDIYQRDEGTILHAIDIWCYADDDGNLHCQVHNRVNEDVTEVITRR